MHTSVNDEMFAMMERYENNIVLISNYWQDKYYIRLSDIVYSNPCFVYS